MGSTTIKLFSEIWPRMLEFIFDLIIHFATRRLELINVIDFWMDPLELIAWIPIFQKLKLNFRAKPREIKSYTV